MKQAQVFEQRRSGVLLHITSLPAANLGQDAYRFVDFLQHAGVSIWQMLPLGPTHKEGSPYQCLSAHAANINLISVDILKQQPWANESELNGLTFSTMMAHAYRQFMAQATESQKHAFKEFQTQQQYWLEDYVLFCEIRHLHHATAWYHWPDELRDRETSAIEKIRDERQEALAIRRFEQFQFFQQWHALKHYANERNVMLFGDMPIFVAHDSVDVWAAPELFNLDNVGQPVTVAGVPPDYFSETGQRWGNPLYRWQKHIDQDFLWWQQRLQTQLELFDLIRIDHFRGFEACWEIPAQCETAIDGQWLEAPGEALFDQLFASFGPLPLVAEDLGIITDDVTALRTKYAMPGMKILQFAFGSGADNPYLPHNHCIDSVTYTGTHDNDTTLGWFNSLNDHDKQRIYHYLGYSQASMPYLLIGTAFSSVSNLAIVPMQDILELGSADRMNTPGTTEGNWQWQFSWEQLDEGKSAKLAGLVKMFSR